MQLTTKSLAKGLALALAPLVVTGLGWFLGGGRAASFAEQPARLAFLAVSMVGFFLAPFAAAKVENLMCKGHSHDRGQDRMVLMATSVSALLAVACPWSDAAGWGVLPGGALLRWVGLVLYTVGFALMVLAPMYLGKQFSIHVTLQEDHELITSGPFAVLRHPRYAGCVYWGFGLPMIFASLPGLLLAVVYAALFLWRIHDEERLLDEHFQQKWRAYAARTRRLVPFIY